MKLKNKFLLGILAVSMVCMILQPNKANAALQSNGGTPETKSLKDWMLKIRQMQELGGTLGRTDTIDTTNLTSNVTDLDIHMEKNSEYGAMAILSASSYGNPNKIEEGETTTGNSTGIVMNINKEWVASGWNVLNYANSRYRNAYPDGYVATPGDAINETLGWHSAGTSYWLDNSSYAGLLRAYKGSIFSYYGVGHHGSVDAYYANGHTSRACIVVGTGI